MFIRQLRAGQANLKVIGVKDLPSLPAAFQIPPPDNHHGLGLKSPQLRSQPERKRQLANHTTHAVNPEVHSPAQR